MPTQKILLVLLLLLTPHTVDIPWRSTVILWNVGQGQFLTWVHSEKCLHFDVGGEMVNSKKLAQVCGRRKNEIFLTHFDRDHISQIPRLIQIVHPQKICLHVLKGQQVKAGRLKEKWPLNPCSHPPPEELQILSPKPPFKNENESSLVFILKNQFLVPGDSTKKQELQWGKALASRPIHTLVAGHHGSKTSTSETLLDELPHLKQVWVSARKARYGHPHPAVTKRLFRRGVPLVSSETWGDLYRRFD